MCNSKLFANDFAFEQFTKRDVSNAIGYGTNICSNDIETLVALRDMYVSGAMHPYDLL